MVAKGKCASRASTWSASPGPASYCTALPIVIRSTCRWGWPGCGLRSEGAGEGVRMPLTSEVLSQPSTRPESREGGRGSRKILAAFKICLSWAWLKRRQV